MLEGLQRDSRDEVKIIGGAFSGRIKTNSGIRQIFVYGLTKRMGGNLLTDQFSVSIVFCCSHPKFCWSFFSTGYEAEDLLISETKLFHPPHLKFGSKPQS